MPQNCQHMFTFNKDERIVAGKDDTQIANRGSGLGGTIYDVFHLLKDFIRFLSSFVFYLIYFRRFNIILSQLLKENDYPFYHEIF